MFVVSDFIMVVGVFCNLVIFVCDVWFLFDGGFVLEFVYLVD